MPAESLEQTLSAEDARKMIASGDAITLDIRDQEEWEESRIAGAVHHPEDAVMEHLDELPEDTAIVVVCADGERSAKLAARLREEGREAASIDGGIDAWMSEGLPPAAEKPPGVRGSGLHGRGAGGVVVG